MTFLQLVQRLRQECGVSGTAPTTTVGQSGEIARLVNWINQAWYDIQSMHEDWLFMRGNVSFNTVDGTQTYTATAAGITSLGNFKRDSFRAYPTGAPESERFLLYIPYDQFRNFYLFGGNRTVEGPPVAFTISPDKDLLFGPIPDAVYNINGEYFQKPALFTADSDEPTIPAQFQMVIVYKAMQFYGQYEAAPEVYAAGMEHYGRMMARLQIDQLPSIEFGGPLA